MRLSYGFWLRALADSGPKPTLARHSELLSSAVCSDVVNAASHTWPGSNQGRPDKFKNVKVLEGVPRTCTHGSRQERSAGMVAVAAGERTVATAEPSTTSRTLVRIRFTFPNKRLVKNQDSRPPV
jgi:hypothetical protein